MVLNQKRGRCISPSFLEEAPLALGLPMQPIVTHLQSNRLIKIRFPSSVTHHHWTIEEKHHKKIYVIPIEGVIMSMLCFVPLTKEELFTSMTAYFPSATEAFEKVLEYLLLQEIIVDSMVKCVALEQDAKLLKSWSLAGWSMAAQYHFFTNDAPYLDYSDQGKGIEKVNQKMHVYHKSEPDTARCKQYKHYLNIRPLPSIDCILDTYELITEN